MKKCLLLGLLLGALFLLVMPVSAEDGDQLRQQMIHSVETGEELDVSGYGLTPAQLQAVYMELYCQGKFPWYADSRIDWTQGTDGLVYVFRPRGLDQQRFDEEAYEREMAQMLSETCLPGMEPWQMALSVHDYIVTHCAYDQTLARNDGFQALVNGKSACFGYAQLYMETMKRVGIPCQIAICDDTGDGVGHAWNVVELDGQWYHVDVTWDDPVPDIYGLVRHDHFLKTDAQFRAQEDGHDFQWDAMVTCDGTTYSSGWFWDDLDSTVVFVDADAMVVRRLEDDTNVIYRIDVDSGEWTRLHRFDQTPVTYGDARYLYKSFGLTSWAGRLYFNGEHKVWSMAFDGTDLRVEHAYEYHGDGTTIYSCAADDGKLFLTMVDMSSQVSTLVVDALDVPVHRHQYTETVVEATCVAEGYTQAVCDCGVSYRYGKTGPGQHQLEERTMADGSVWLVCALCGLKQEDQPQTEPTFVTVPAVTGTVPSSQQQETGGGGVLWLVCGGVALVTVAVVVCVLVAVKARDDRRRKRRPPAPAPFQDSWNGSGPGW